MRECARGRGLTGVATGTAPPPLTRGDLQQSGELTDGGRPVQDFYGVFTMSLNTLIIFLLIGAIAGWLAGQLMRGRGLGLVGNIVVGIIGAYVGGWLLGGVLGLAIGGGLLGAIINATIGAVVVLAIIGVIKRA
jgi:uncharacterized membrane protein YeaQ/YmgE (transglycosylase-associated protein family)